MILFTADIHGKWIDLYEKAPPNTKCIFICGDAEPVRFEDDLDTIPTPKKYLQLGDFHYFWKKGEVPIPTYFFLGNHEPFLWLKEYEKEGPKEIIKNLWCLNRSGFIELCGLKIAYLSRVFAPKTFFGDRNLLTTGKKPKRAGHFLKEDVEILLKKKYFKNKIDILALHGNPNYCNDERGKDIYAQIVKTLRPNLIICGHMHEWLFEEFCGVKVIGIGMGKMWSINCRN